MPAESSIQLFFFREVIFSNAQKSSIKHPRFQGPIWLASTAIAAIIIPIRPTFRLGWTSGRQWKLGTASGGAAGTCAAAAETSGGADGMPAMLPDGNSWGGLMLFNHV